MLIRSKEIEFDSNKLIEALEDESVMSYREYSEAYHLVLDRYIYIRNILNCNCCRKPLIDEIITKLKTDEESMNKVKHILGYGEEEIMFYVEFTKHYNESIL